jgi:hypothetical protein
MPRETAPRRIRRSFGDELAPARGDRAGLGGRALDAQHHVGHRLQPFRRDRLSARVAQPVGAFVELGQRTLRALEAGLQRCADPDLGQPADRLDRAIPDPLAEALRRPALGALGEGRDARAAVVAVRLEVTPDRIEVGHVPETLERTGSSSSHPGRLASDDSFRLTGEELHRPGARWIGEDRLWAAAPERR